MIHPTRGVGALFTPQVLLLLAELDCCRRILHELPPADAEGVLANLVHKVLVGLHPMHLGVAPFPYTNDKPICIDSQAPIPRWELDDHHLWKEAPGEHASGYLHRLASLWPPHSPQPLRLQYLF